MSAYCDRCDVSMDLHPCGESAVPSQADCVVALERYDTRDTPPAVLSGRELFWRLLAAGSLAVSLLAAHYVADTRERLARMEDEVRVLVADCQQRATCEYSEGRP